MFEFIFDVFMLAVIFFMLAAMFFAFDALVLHGIFAISLRNRISKFLE